MIEKRWYTLADGRQIYRAVPQSRSAGSGSSFPCPRVVNDSIEPTWGADGKLYTSMSAYRATLRPSGNPKGEEYIEYGNEPIPEYVPPAIDEAARVEAIKHAIHDVETGNVPVPEYVPLD
jgi:hypothetical protein